ncbi:Transposable element Tc1 transposase [Labeo rohita]|uniref:Transposable element Tc1 transposase n=1 Tax=Labeo rohita TaxID=84645 RepID=A0ABQ8L7R1_LABRO|nr:Transposable element Tc1 transposase [Labeo rohita]
MEDFYDFKETKWNALRDAGILKIGDLVTAEGWISAERQATKDGCQSSSVGYTIMRKTADLTVVQKMTIDTLHKEGKTQKVIAKEAGCSQSSVSKEAKGRKRCGRKKCTSNRDNRTLERIVKQNPFKNVGEIHKEWTAAGVSASRTTTHRRMQDMGFSCHIPCVKPLLNNRQRQKCLAWAKDKKDWTAAEWSKVMFSDESKFCISFGNQGPRVWRKTGQAQNSCRLRSSVKFPQSVMVWGAMSSAGVGPLCFLRSKVNAAVYQDVLEHFMLPAADQLYGDADFIFQQDLATSTWFNDHGIPVLNWPANSPDLNLIENLWGIVKRKMRYARPNNAEELKATIRATWALITPEQCHRLIDSMPRRIAAVIQAKGASTKY